MFKPIAWGITGGGHFLEEVFGLMIDLKNEYQITSFVSKAGEEVIRIYGLGDRLLEISDGRRYSELFTEQSEGASAIHAGRLSRKIYSKLVVAPATANTVAKICLGIADSLVTNIVAQALKGGTDILILPTDQLETTETILPVTVDKSLCIGCDPCPAVTDCRNMAFYMKEDLGSIDYLKCIGCGLCVKACKYGAVSKGEKILVKGRKIDLENVQRLIETNGIKVVRNPEELRVLIRERESQC